MLTEDCLLLQIAECVTFIESKLAELEKDRAELVEFQKLDKTKRSIEYALRDRELEDTRAQLAKVPTILVMKKLAICNAPRVPCIQPKCS